MKYAYLVELFKIIMFFLALIETFADNIRKPTYNHYLLDLNGRSKQINGKNTSNPQVSQKKSVDFFQIKNSWTLKMWKKKLEKTTTTILRRWLTTLEKVSMYLVDQ